jgi:hypothetical protein
MTTAEFIAMGNAIEHGDTTDTRPAIDLIDLLSGGIAALARSSIRSVVAKAIPEASAGTKIFRVWGDGAGAWGRSWTPVDPRTVANFRNIAGLPNQNSGRFVSEGILQNAEGVTTRGALPLHGNAGELPELIVPNPQSQISLWNVQGLNPEF